MSNDPKKKTREKIEEMHSEVFHSLFTLVPLSSNQSAYFPLGSHCCTLPLKTTGSLAEMLLWRGFFPNWIFQIKSAIKNDNDKLLSVCLMFSLRCIVANNSYNNISDALSFLQRIKS